MCIYSVHLQCTLYSVHCTVCIVQCKFYNVQCTVFSVQCTVYSVQCTVYSVQCTCRLTLRDGLSNSTFSFYIRRTCNFILFTCFAKSFCTPRYTSLNPSPKDQLIRSSVRQTCRHYSFIFCGYIYNTELYTTYQYLSLFVCFFVIMSDHN